LLNDGNTGDEGAAQRTSRGDFREIRDEFKIELSQRIHESPMNSRLNESE
jgi:hypothetical protein